MVDRALGNRYRCEFAATAAQAHRKLASTTFQLALCDIQMLGASGLALAEEITEQHPETAVVLITEKDDPEVARRAFAFGGHGVHGYLVKPLRPGELLIAVMNALRRRELEISERSYRLDLQAQAIDELRLSRQETVERLSKAIELHDSSTGEHVDRMAEVAAFLATRLGLDSTWVDLLRLAAPMHDVGKIATPDGILRKPGPLTPEEREEMKRHTTVGFEILADSKSELLRVAANIALTHHERYDGSGYPYGLTGEEIPLEGRISAVADVFDATLSDRC
ncbi:MAG TPA: HD domain-containing phosphohydrolase, partial [Solirubrobacterales bacterium]|nr:HD domain-containing phosphohydrolase [Solirubrobacterales bacterium]